VKSWALDLDGVIWTGTEAIAGSADAVRRIRSAGASVVFVTNNSFSTLGEQEQKLGSFGIDAAGAVITSAQAGASLVEPGERVFVLGGPGVREALGEREAEVVTSGTIDVVIVGLDWDLSYPRLSTAVQAVLAGARFIATNTDPTYPTEKGLAPGAGAIVAAVSAATAQQPIVAGKPHEAQALMVRRVFGEDGIMVGDRPDTDGLFAAALGYDFALVLSGVTSSDHLPVVPPPDLVAANLAELVTTYFA